MKQKSFILSALSEDNVPSSKRIICFILLLLFVFEVLYNLFTGKVPTSILVDQLYYLLVTNIGVILGSNVINTVKDIKITQSNNNAKVDSPSPTPTVTVLPSPQN